MPTILNKKTDVIPPDAIYVDRGSKWGNPYKVGDSKWKLGIPTGLGEADLMTRREVVDRYEWRLRATEYGATLMTQIEELRGKDLVCWCSPLLCHAEILMELANE